MSGQPVVSADSHVNEPPDLWVSRVPEQFRARAPRVEAFEQGDAWVLEGAAAPINFGRNCTAGLPAEEQRAWMRWEEVPRAGYEGAARLAAQDRDGVVAEVLYPTPRIANQVLFHRDDVEFHLACVRAYNDWLAELAGHDPARIWGVAMLPTVGVDAALEEFRRCLALPGLRGVMLGRYPTGDVQISPADDAVWALAEETSTPVSIHVAFALQAQGEVAAGTIQPDMRFFDAPVRAAQFVKSGVFDRFPALSLVLAEVDSGWLPYAMEQMDDRFGRAAAASRPPIEMRPSDYFLRNIFSTYVTDTYGIRNRAAVGVTQMMWSSDYPHAGSDWPHSRKVLDDTMQGVPARERDLIVGGTATRLYATS